MKEHLTLLHRLLRADTSIVLASAIVSNALRLISTTVLTHFLAPEAFGIMAIILSITFIVGMLADAGMYSFIIRSDISDQGLLDAIWSIRLLRSIIIAILVALTGPLISFYSGTDIILEVAVYSICIAVDGFSSLAFATAVKAGKQVQVSALEIIPQIIGLGFSIGLAVILQSHWALIWASIVIASVKTVVSYTLFDNSYRRFHIDFAIARDLWAYGRAIVLASAIQAGITQSDKIILVKILTLSQFGLYGIATSLIVALKTAVTMYSKRVLYPSYVRGADLSPVGLSRVYYHTGLKLRIAYMFASGAIITCSQSIVRILYDDSYAGASTFLEILAVTLLVTLSCTATIELLFAQGKTRHVLNLNLIRVSMLIVVGLILFGWIGALGIVAAVAAMEIAAQIYCWWALLRNQIFQWKYEAASWASGAIGMLVGAAANRVLLLLF